MADYVPYFKPGDDLTFTAGADITAGQLVYLSAANTVTPTSAATAVWVGVATQTVSSGGRVTVSRGGVHELTVNAAVVAGDVLMAATTGRVTPLSGTTYTQVVGIALTAQASAGSTCRVLIR